jgi:threonine dehydratase
MKTTIVPTLERLREAYARTGQATRKTPLLESEMLARTTGARRVFIKAESLQLSGSFKLRGAYWRLTRLSEAEAKRGVVAFSSGNFAQGLAAAGRSLGIPVTIVMPIDVPDAKRAATVGYGARVILTDHRSRGREDVAAARAREIATKEGLVLLHPFDDPEIVAGQAGVGLETLNQLSEAKVTADLLLCPVGGGGLIAGMSLVFGHLSPDTGIVAVEPTGYDGLGSSLAKGAPTTVPIVQRSICDGLMARRPGDAPFAAVSAVGGLVGVTVSDSEVRDGMRVAFESLKLVLEPSGAASIAALLAGKVEVADKTLVLIATGGNIAYDIFAEQVGNM